MALLVGALVAMAVALGGGGDTHAAPATHDVRSARSALEGLQRYAEPEYRRDTELDLRTTALVTHEKFGDELIIIAKGVDGLSAPWYVMALFEIEPVDGSWRPVMSAEHPAGAIPAVDFFRLSDGRWVVVGAGLLVGEEALPDELPADALRAGGDYAIGILEGGPGDR